MELKNLISFKTVAELKSFSKASIALGYAQSSITFHIKQLEEELGVCLFDRIGNTIRLTDSGYILLEYSQKILSLSEEAKHALNQNSTPSGTLKIAGISSLCSSLLPQLIKKYNAAFPDVTISATTVSKLQVIEKVNEGSADVGLYIDFEAPSEDSYTAIYMENPLCFICSVNNTISKDSISIKDLEGVPIIATEPKCSYRELLTSLFIKNNITPSIIFDTENTEVIKRFVQSDLGISFLPEISVRQELAAHILRKLNISESIPPLYINVIHKKNQWLTPATKEFFSLFEA